MMIVQAEYMVDGDVGDVWRCDDCQRLWQCRRSLAFPGKAWSAPNLFVRVWFGRVGKKDSGLSVFEEPVIDLARTASA